MSRRARRRRCPPRALIAGRRPSSFLRPRAPLSLSHRLFLHRRSTASPSSNSSHTHPPKLPSCSKIFSTTDEIESAREPLVDGVSSGSSYSLRATILPFLFPALVMHVAPIYIAETSPRQIRGILVSMKEFFIILGLLLGYTISSIYVDTVAGWRYMYASSAPVCPIMGIGMWWLPPSPRWLLLSATQGKQNITTIKQLAVSCFRLLWGQATDSSSLAEVDSILDELHADLEKHITFGEIFQGKCLKALIIGAGLVFFSTGGRATKCPVLCCHHPSECWI